MFRPISQYPTISKHSENYPKLLKKINHSPQTLYYRGTLRNHLFPIAVVGSRKMTEYGKHAVDLIISGLRGLPVSIISGMAYGIDSQAHRAAIENKIHTVAVLGSGIDDQSVYPRAHRRLAKEIIESGGAVISEYPDGTPALDYHFPSRNRIISGMSKAIIIAEADIKSGSLITAKLALDQGRDVFAVPGSIFSNFSSGANKLIKEGAIPVTSARDIISQYQALSAISQLPDIVEKQSSLTAIQQKILSLIGHEPISLDKILAKTNLSLSELNSNIIVLEINSEISGCGNNCYIRNLTKGIKYG